jgi:hypothetical protein
LCPEFDLVDLNQINVRIASSEFSEKHSVTHSSSKSHEQGHHTHLPIKPKTYGLGLFGTRSGPLAQHDPQQKKYVWTNENKYLDETHSIWSKQNEIYNIE